jgi:hypothetical protein
MDDIRVKHSGYVDLQKIDDGHDGNLCVMEGLRHIPFSIKRVYYINNLENCVSVRGKHAHKELSQVIFCISGSFMLTLDDGENRQELLMYRDNLGVVLGPRLWHEMHSFSSGCLLLVAASDYYDESDYLRDYDEFLAFVRDNPEAP